MDPVVTNRVFRQNPKVVESTSKTLVFRCCTGKGGRGFEAPEESGRAFGGPVTYQDSNRWHCRSAQTSDTCLSNVPHLGVRVHESVLSLEHLCLSVCPSYLSIASLTPEPSAASLGGGLASPPACLSATRVFVQSSLLRASVLHWTEHTGIKARVQSCLPLTSWVILVSLPPLSPRLPVEKHQLSLRLTEGKRPLSRACQQPRPLQSPALTRGGGGGGRRLCTDQVLRGPASRSLRLKKWKFVVPHSVIRSKLL